MLPGPPSELKPLTRRTQRVLLPLWLACLAFAVFLQAGATWRVATFQLTTNPAFSSLGLYVQQVELADWDVAPISSEAVAQEARGRIVAIDGRPLDRGASALDAARLLSASASDRVSLRFAARSSPMAPEVRLTKSDAHRSEVFSRQVRWHSIVTHIADLVIATLFVVIASLLKTRRPEDPVATLLSFAMLFIATLGCWRIWDWLGIGADTAEPFLHVAWLSLLLTAIPAIPDGRYVPRSARWFMVLGPVAALLLVWNTQDLIDAAIMAALAASVLASVIIRLAWTTQGTERQQLKWALLGIGAGVLLWIPAGSIEAHFWSDLPLLGKAFVDVSKRLGLVILGVTLLFSLAKFRLNDADRALARSSSYGAVTAIVGGVWAVGAYFAAEIMKAFEQVPSEPIAVAVSSLLAALIFTPAKTRIESWVDERFRGPLLRLQTLPDRIKWWQDDDVPEAVAQRVLEEICAGVGATSAAVWRSSIDGVPDMLVAHRVPPEDIRAHLQDGSSSTNTENVFPLRFDSNNGAGNALTLLVGRRSDLASYTREERRAVAAVVEPLSDALRVVSRRAAHNRVVVEAIAGISAKLARLRGSDI